MSDLQQLRKALLEALAEEIRLLLELSNEERELQYGTRGWKLLIEKYISLTL